MPWEKSFDTDTALEQAMEVFWAKGYEATSLSDLLSATGINKGSFYNAFGSKKKIFTESLLKYEREKRRIVLAGFSELNDPVLAITMFFDELVKQAQSDKEKKGCFLVNTALDLPNHDSDIEKSVKKSLKDTERFFEQQIALGIEQGSIPSDIDPKLQSKGLLGLVVAIRVLSRGVYDKASLNALKSQAISLVQ